MIRAVIISGILFTIGNIVWKDYGDPKLYYAPMALFLLLLVVQVTRTYTGSSEYIKAFLVWLVALAAGNFIKQLFYTEKVAQIADYWWGGVITGLLILSLCYLWLTTRKR